MGEVAWLLGGKKKMELKKKECYHADGRTNKQVKIELLSQWMLEAEFRN